ncbi:MAG: hypothetical protein KDB53_00745 [Planctomycetes bacterium]|nr:hypothetical protein [Planctomycetota bacterium]
MMDLNETLTTLGRLLEDENAGYEDIAIVVQAVPGLRDWIAGRLPASILAQHTPDGHDFPPTLRLLRLLGFRRIRREANRFRAYADLAGLLDSPPQEFP